MMPVKRKEKFELGSVHDLTVEEGQRRELENRSHPDLVYPTCGQQEKPQRISPAVSAGMIAFTSLHEPFQGSLAHSGSMLRTEQVTNYCCLPPSEPSRTPCGKPNPQADTSQEKLNLWMVASTLF